jgi:hypothetical protein
MTSADDRIAGEALYLPRVPAVAGNTTLHKQVVLLPVYHNVDNPHNHQVAVDSLLVVKPRFERIVLAMVVVGCCSTFLESGSLIHVVQ